jgi:uncharacterized protein
MSARPFGEPSARPAAQRSRWLRLGAIATAAGAFSGLFGVGGGTIIVPLLVLWLGYGHKEATGTSLAAIIVIGVLAAAGHALYGNVDLWKGVLISIPAVAGGLLGVGGGVLFVPALVVFADQSQLSAEATSLVAIVLVSLVGTWRQRGYGNVRLREGLLVGILSPLGVLVGVVLANAVSERVLELSFAAVQLAFAWQLAKKAGLR